MASIVVAELFVFSMHYQLIVSPCITLPSLYPFSPAYHADASSSSSNGVIVAVIIAVVVVCLIVVAIVVYIMKKKKLRDTQNLIKANTTGDQAL